jgi:hypothetical protein
MKPGILSIGTLLALLIFFTMCVAKVLIRFTSLKGKDLFGCSTVLAMIIMIVLVCRILKNDEKRIEKEREREAAVSSPEM